MDMNLDGVLAQALLDPQGDQQAFDYNYDAYASPAADVFTS